MTSSNLAIGMVYLLQIMVGIMGNSCVLLRYFFLYFTGFRERSTDMILRHLTVANCLVIISKGGIEVMVSFGLINFLSDLGCKLVFYVHRVGRGVSIGTTCLLSVFQAIMISPRDSRWAELKTKAPRYIGSAISLCWILSMLVNIIFLVYVTGKGRSKNISWGREIAYCSSTGHDIITQSLYALLLSFPDVLCLGLMLWASSFMVFILYRHKQQVGHIHGNKLSPRSCPESRAAHTILILTCTFASSYILSCFIQVCIAVLDNPHSLLMNTASLVNACFPTLCPFLLISRDSSATLLCFAWIKGQIPLTSS